MELERCVICGAELTPDVEAQIAFLSLDNDLVILVCKDHAAEIKQLIEKTYRIG